MPYKIIKNGKCYQVVNNKTGKIYSYCSTKNNADAQLRLLRSLEFR